ncbi:MAG: hypothetical protein ABWZ98_13840 [Nakamurella sp.]
MTFPAPLSVASGCPYTVTDVSGHRPERLDDFVGEVSFTAVKDEQRCSISGIGGFAGGNLRFYEKDLSTGRDLRVWQVIGSPAIGFEAQALSRY